MAKSRSRNDRAPQTACHTTAATVDREVVAQRAYELYLERGAEDGHDLDDWLTAERQLREGETAHFEQ